MTKVSFELEYEQVDAIVLQELQHSYEQLLRDWDSKTNVYDTREELDNTIKCFERVIQYFMVHTEFDAYMSGFPLRSLD